MLKDIVTQTRPIKVDETQTFSVRGLTLTDLGVLLKDYYTPLNKLMEGNVDFANIADEYPEFIAKVIAHGAEDPALWQKVMGFPILCQLEALEACWDLTIPDFDALGKLVARVQKLTQQLPEKKASE